MLGKKTKKFFSLFLSALTAASMMPLSSVTTMAAQNDTCDTCGNSTDSNGFCTVDDCGGYEKPSQSDNKYQIENAGHLYWFANYVNTTSLDYGQSIDAELTANIDLNPGYTFNSDGTVTYNGEIVTEGFREWTPIGNSDYPYTGSFVGGNLNDYGSYAYLDIYTISGIYIDNPTADNQGLFGCVAYDYYSYPYSKSPISFIGIENSYICGNDYVGGISGSEYSEINYCYNAGTVKGNNYIGGICPNGTVSCSYNSGDISATGSYVGGICGQLPYDEFKISFCYNKGSVHGNGAYVGGICGSGYAESCYNIGTVKGESSNVGAICGGMNNWEPYNCFYLPDCTKDGNNTTQNALGCNTLGSTAINTYGSAEMTEEQFKSGEVAFCLNPHSSGYSNNIFRQYCSYEYPDLADYPEFSGCAVYKYYSCKAHYPNAPLEIVYSNTSTDQMYDPYNIPILDHNFDSNGLCKICQAPQPPKPVSRTHYSKLLETHNGYSVIENIGNLLYISSTSSSAGNYVLANNISNVISSYNEMGYNETKLDWTPIKEFSGIIDGNGNTLYIDSESGLIDTLRNGTIKNLNLLVAVKATNNSYVGGVCAYADGGTITNCTISGGVEGNDYVGGVYGYGTANVSDCTISVGVYGNRNIGGVCGYNDVPPYGYSTDPSTITNIKYTGSVGGTENVGGICGYNKHATISNCEHSGSVGGSIFIGGICGYNFDGTIENCTKTYEIHGTGNVGGISGNAVNGTIDNCVNKATIYGEYNIGGICGNSNDYEYYSNNSILKISSCNNIGDVTGTQAVGGIFGCAAPTVTISECFNEGTITKSENTTGTYGCGIGGIVGMSPSTISNCYNKGTIIANDTSGGGICGSNMGKINNCYNIGSVSGKDSHIGAICGYNLNHSYEPTYNGKISNSYYLTGCAKDGSGTIQYGIGNATMGSTTADTIGITTAKTKTQFSSGEVAYLLNGENAGTENAIWKQNVGTDDYPTFDGNTVYFDATGYKLRGTITLKLEETKLAGVYRGVVDLPAGTYKFVVDDLVNNKSYGRASTYTDNIANCGFGNNWGYCTLETTGGRYTFTFNSKNNYLSVTCDNSYAESFSTYKLRGSVNAVLTKTDNENIIKNTVVLPAGSYKFVVTDDATGISYGRHASYDATIENALCGNNWGYINFTAQATGTYEFTYNTKTNRITVVKK
ncbi:MAG: hypothetical protein U0L20_03530 [Ruminococcus sp.]|nr:hypothetical protein [Ruminococcus sp.]